MENCEKKKKFFLVSQSYAFKFFIIAREHLRARRQQLFTRAETPKHACTVDTRIFRRSDICFAVADEETAGFLNAEPVHYVKRGGRVGF